MYTPSRKAHVVQGRGLVNLELIEDGDLVRDRRQRCSVEFPELKC